jgi:hypothetical protein
MLIYAIAFSVAFRRDDYCDFRLDPRPPIHATADCFKMYNFVMTYTEYLTQYFILNEKKQVLKYSKLYKSAFFERSFLRSAFIFLKIVIFNG